MASRSPNQASSIYQGKDGYWHGRVTVGFRDDGTLDRRHTMSKDRATVTRKVRELEKLRDSGAVAKVGQKWTVASWLRHWLDVIAEPNLRPSSAAAYRTAIEKHLIPGLGKQKLDRLQPEHLERLYRKMIDNGAKPATAHQVHRTMRTALGEAVRRGHVSRNVAALARPPRIEPEPVEPLSLEEVQQLLAAAETEPNGARWAVALALGLRQGEALGLRWTDVDFERGLIFVAGSRPRPVYAHGCKTACGKTPGRCPDRVQTNPDHGPTKSVAGRRAIGLPEELAQILKRHRAEQEEARAFAANLWEPGEWVFCGPTGKPINPNTDYHRWKVLLQKAGVRDARLHDARHTAATVLLVLGVPERTVMGIMGWSSTAMAARYQHVTDPIRATVANQVGGLLWDLAKKPG
ncbi:tyrosine-type recombinase/integrase [Luteococcus sp. Sow4_B9]|uniref:tyrosine-type recombinase/integrase n=1 Tax=Luteococcus sp. Sow4_B9 TaxID=3438792 RepID=UPI003F99A510